jgi:hypothetical protein
MLCSLWLILHSKSCFYTELNQKPYIIWQLRVLSLHNQQRVAAQAQAQAQAQSQGQPAQAATPPQTMNASNTPTPSKVSLPL